MQFIEPLREDKKLKYYLDTGEYKKVGIFFGHGIGDCVMFMVILDRLKEMYSDISFKMILQKGLDEETIYPDCLFGSSLKEIEESNYDLDLVATVHFPVEVPGMTKSEQCCIEEIGIEPISEYKLLPKFPSKLCAVHFNLTCLPELANPDRDIAEMIWNDILEAGWIPIETHFEHVFHNPVNEKFDFVDCTVRRCTPKISTLVGLIQQCGAFVGVVSGNFHVAMATLPHERIAFLEKEIPVARFTNEPIQSFNIKDYQKGSITLWLNDMLM
jgi:hypothetical protein